MHNRPFLTRRASLCCIDQTLSFAAAPMSTPGGHAEGESQVEGGFHAAGERDAEEEAMYQQFKQQRAAAKAAEEQRKRQQEEQEAQARAAAQRAEEERAAAAAAAVAAALAAERAEFAGISIGTARVLLLDSTFPAKGAIDFPLPAAPTVAQLSAGDLPEVYAVPAELEAARPPDIHAPMLQAGTWTRSAYTTHNWFATNKSLVTAMIAKYPP